MPEKVIILELKEEYALAMEEGGRVIRIRRKKDLKPGDEVYVLPEDYWEEPAKSKVIPFTGGEHSGRWIRRMVATAAMLALVLMLVLPALPTRAYAVVSFDAQRGLQMNVDKNYKILDAVSCDGSISSEQLGQMKGKNLMDLGTDIPRLVGKGPILIAYAPCDAQDDQQAETQIRNLFAGQELVYFSGSSEDISRADASAVSLGKYILGVVVDQEHMQWLGELFDDYYDDDDMLDDESDEDEKLWEVYGHMDADALIQVLKENPSYISSEAFRELLADKLEEKHEQSETAEAQDDDEPDDDNEPDDGDEPENSENVTEHDIDDKDEDNEDEHDIDDEDDIDEDDED